MPVQIENEDDVQFDANYDRGGAAYLLYDAQALPSTPPHVQVDLIDISGTKLTINDFTHNSVAQEVYAHRVDATGGLSAWSRSSTYVESPTYSYPASEEDQIDEFDVMVLAQATGGSAPTYTTQQGAAQAGASEVRVKIIKRGSRPNIFVRRR